MAPVEGADLLLREGEGAQVIDLGRVQWGLIVQALSADRLSCVGGALVAADFTPRKCHWVQGRSTGSSSGVYVIKLITL